MPERPLAYDLPLEGFTDLLAGWGEPAYRARQVWQGLYRHYWNHPGQFTILPGGLRSRLDESLRFDPLAPSTTLESTDGATVKTLFELADGNAIEAVLMRYDPATHSGQGRRTLCISTQAGCAMGCVFCATGQMGFKRHLSSGEIVAQAIYYARTLAAAGEKATNIVFMGMGEPFHNYENTMAAIDRLNDQRGYNFGARRITISTVGLAPFIRRFAAEKRQVNLAISLHAADDDSRGRMLPVNRKYPLADVLEACREYIQSTGRRVTFEWALVAGVNDTPEQARLLAGLLKGMLCHVNAIPLNPTAGYSGQATTRQRAEEFRAILEQAGIPCTVRTRRGIDIQAGCGQLASRKDMGWNI
ncbi:MAG: 23S rRNA (adenine(2503)-C(2))-methyltransferase RlmN [Chloroflexi bacterium]|nr:23S rRNA (adenine(2503)-C(2))-methyltransferase RlmN [Chloroflexota bacterium]